MAKIIRGSLLIDGTGAEPVRNPTIRVEDGLIHEVGTWDSVEPGDADELIDLGETVLMPGLMDVHTHIMGARGYGVGDWLEITTPHDLKVLRGVADCRTLLEAGFTTVRDCGSNIAINLRRAVNEGTIIGPHIYTAGLTITQTGGHGDTHFIPIEEARKFAYIADGVDQCRAAARAVIRDGADLIKIHTTGGIGSEKDHPWDAHFTVDEIRAITDEAHKAGLRVATHSQGAQGVKNALLGGVDTIEHGYFLDDEAIQMMLDHDAYFVPTFALIDVYKQALETPHDMPPWRLRKQRQAIEAMEQSFLAAYHAGVKIATGPDYFGGALRAHGDNADEPITMVKYGMDPADALQALTRVSAEVIGIEKETGTVEVGKWGDLVGLGGNPLEDITHLKRSVQFVMKDGEVYVNRVS